MILIPTSDHPFYLWQSLVQMTAMENLGIDDVQWIFYTNKRASSQLRKIMDAGLARISVWPDWPRDTSYNAAMKPWLVGKWLSKHPEYVDDNNLVIDPDVVPTGKPFLDAEPGVVFGTDTDSYTGPNYLKSKNAWGPLCNLVGVDHSIAEQYSGIGAQVLFTGIEGHWWESVAKLSVTAFNKIKNIPSDDGNNVQAWCAEMYVTQLQAIKDGLEPRVEPRMSMIWADGAVADYYKHGFFHDAGQIAETGVHFCKLSHQNSPWKKPIKVSSDSASSIYVDLINETAERYPDLIW